MSPAEPAFTLGVEEEYLLVRRETGDLVPDPPEDLVDECARALDGRVANEFLRAQVEIATGVCADIGEARRDLRRLRGGVAEACADRGLAPVAASTHPFGDWRQQDYVHKARYEDLAHDMQAVAHRLLICGMHVHVGVEDEELRIDLMNQARYFLPHLLCLTTSSPFWQGRNTGLKSYRLTVFDSLPRTGPPEPVSSWSEYQRMIRQMTHSGLLEDGSKIWWDLRPSARYPTLEMRICDVCPDLEDALAVAALFQCLLRMLYRLRTGNQRWREYSNMLVRENRWLAQRYGSRSELVDFGKGALVPFADLIDEMLDLVREDAMALGCAAEVERARRIARDGTSAERQVATYEASGGDGDADEALRAVVRGLMAETVAGAA